MTLGRLKLASICGVAAVLAGNASAQFDIQGTSELNRGTLERQIKVNDFVDVRANAEVIAVKPAHALNERDTETELEFESLGTFVDVRPFQNSFVITGGLYSGDRSRIDAATSGTTTNGDTTRYLPEQNGKLKMAVKGDDVAPFVGFGYDTTYNSDRRWGVKVMAGALFSGTPEVAMTSRSGPQSSDSIVRLQLDRQRQQFDTEDPAKTVHPVVQVGLSYRF
ncbi:hypothetical protein WNY37_06230 [Henriciella sp. AS95]|uniref:hypothetical protein n=1 Tax=Henriciella sp. AS95 TaxID=3135782 RepID=UPI0031750FBE